MQRATIRAATIVKSKCNSAADIVPRCCARNLKHSGIGHGALSWQEREREEEEEEQVLVPTVLKLLSLRVSKIQALRFVSLEEWFPDPRLVRKGPFWTKLQRAFYDAICCEPVKCCAHRRLTVEGLAKAVGATKE